MSDEKRNISDINDQKTIDRTDQAALDQTAEQQAFSEEIRRRLAAPDSGKPTLEEFKVMVYKDREKRRKKRNTLVACIVAAFIVGFLTFDDLVPEVGADKNPKETIQTEDGVIIEDGGWGSSTGEDDVVIIKEWNDIEEARNVVEALPIPQYIPKAYAFKQLELNLMKTGGVRWCYIFTVNTDVLEIEGFHHKAEKTSLEVDDVIEAKKTKKGMLYIQEGKEKATIQLEDGTIVSIWGKISVTEMVCIIEGLEN